jgi:integrase/recombinase XerD
MLDEFKAELTRTGKSKNTIDAYVSDVKHFQKWLVDSLGEDQDIDKVTESDVRNYVQYLNIIKKRSVATINREVKSIIRYNSFLNTIGFSSIVINLKAVEQKAVEDVEVKVIDDKDLRRLERTIELADNKRDLCIYNLLLNTGVRCSELINLELDDIVLTERNGKNTFSYITVRNGKGNKNRMIPLNAKTVTAINEYLKVRPQTDSKKLLIGQRGALTRLAINKLLERYCHDARIDTVTPHMFRHTTFTKMVKAGTDIKTVSELAGHSSTDITFKYYVNSSLKDKIDAVDCLLE